MIHHRYVRRFMPDGTAGLYFGYWGWRNYVREYHWAMHKAFDKALRNDA
jgi:hypothetical protein